MLIETIEEHEDGSATVSLDMTNEEVKMLINWAFVELLKKGIEEGKKYTPTEKNDEQSFPSLGNTEY
jgi:hypothetical protein